MVILCPMSCCNLKSISKACGSYHVMLWAVYVYLQWAGQWRKLLCFAKNSPKVDHRKHFGYCSSFRFAVSVLSGEPVLIYDAKTEGQKLFTVYCFVPEQQNIMWLLYADALVPQISDVTVPTWVFVHSLVSPLTAPQKHFSHSAWDTGDTFKSYGALPTGLTVTDVYINIWSGLQWWTLQRWKTVNKLVTKASSFSRDHWQITWFIKLNDAAQWNRTQAAAGRDYHTRKCVCDQIARKMNRGEERRRMTGSLNKTEDLMSLFNSTDYHNSTMSTPALIYKAAKRQPPLTVASLQTVHLTTCWCSFPSRLMSDWHTRQLMTGTPPASGLAMAV